MREAFVAPRRGIAELASAALALAWLAVVDRPPALLAAEEPSQARKLYLQGKYAEALQFDWGKPVDPEKIYTISACERDGDPADMLCRFRGVQEAANTPYSLHQIMRSYLQENMVKILFGSIQKN
mgnify:CR=1 FL=1